MPNAAHLAKLMEGVVAWNEWRRKNPEIQLDLSEADLLGANLNRAILSRGDPRRAYLYEAQLRAADLSGANLRGAKHYVKSRQSRHGLDMRPAYLRMLLPR